MFQCGCRRVSGWVCVSNPFQPFPFLSFLSLKGLGSSRGGDLSQPVSECVCVWVCLADSCVDGREQPLQQGHTHASAPTHTAGPSLQPHPTVPPMLSSFLCEGRCQLWVCVSGSVVSLCEETGMIGQWVGQCGLLYHYMCGGVVEIWPPDGKAMTSLRVCVRVCRPWQGHITWLTKCSCTIYHLEHVSMCKCVLCLLGWNHEQSNMKLLHRLQKVFLTFCLTFCLNCWIKNILDSKRKKIERNQGNS